MGRIGWLAPEC